MDLPGYIAYTIGVNRAMEREELRSMCKEKFPDAPESAFDDEVSRLVTSGKVFSFGSSLSISSGTDDHSEPEHREPWGHRVMMAAGALALLGALMMDTSVPVETPRGTIRVNNLGLMNTRTICAIAGAGFLVAGVVLMRKGASND